MPPQTPTLYYWEGFVTLAFLSTRDKPPRRPTDILSGDGGDPFVSPACGTPS